MTKTEFLLRYHYNIKQTSDENKEKYQLEDYWLIQYQIPKTNITRTVWQTVRRIINEILGVKGLQVKVKVLLASWSWPQYVANSFIFPALFWITQIFYFILFSYKDQTLCPHVIWHDFLYTKTRFEGFKLLYFSLFATSVWFVKKSCKF